MKRNLIVLGDSFCSTANQWPQQLADHLGLNLICYTEGAGQSWWAARKWLTTLPKDRVDAAEVMVFAHTNAERIATDNRQIGLVDHSQPPTTELETAIHLYNKYIFDPTYTYWAQRAWFKEIKELYGNKQLVHLHCFPWTQDSGDLLTGINISTNLTAVSLNELGAERFGFFADTRANHLNEHNNRALARQLAAYIQQGHSGDLALDLTEFDQLTDRWLNWR